MDPFDDIFAPVTTNVRAGVKFQPKLRQQPRKATLASAPKLVACGNFYLFLLTTRVVIQAVYLQQNLLAHEVSSVPLT